MNNFNKKISIDKITIYVIFIALQPHIKSINELQEQYINCDPDVYTASI